MSLEIGLCVVGLALLLTLLCWLIALSRRAKDIDVEAQMGDFDSHLRFEINGNSATMDESGCDIKLINAWCKTPDNKLNPTPVDNYTTERHKCHMMDANYNQCASNSSRCTRRQSIPEIFNDTAVYSNYRTPKMSIVSEKNGIVHSFDLTNPFLSNIIQSSSKTRQAPRFYYEYCTPQGAKAKDDSGLQVESIVQSNRSRKRPICKVNDPNSREQKQFCRPKRLDERPDLTTTFQNKFLVYFRNPNEIEPFFKGKQLENAFRVFLSPTNPFR